MTSTVDNPLRYRRYVWRGWKRLIHKIVSFGIPYSDGDHTLVPVQYANGEYGVLVGSTTIIHGHLITHARELRAFVNEECTDMIRDSKGLPEVLAVLSDCYKIGVTDGTFEHEVYIRRRRDALASEQVVILVH